MQTEDLRMVEVPVTITIIEGTKVTTQTVIGQNTTG